ncbi:hypothetical protein [Streptomyces chartreusis]|uniref:hypothetical protein n=1 Tax=Streptomyces chartreusis TaxID=1969 RepID=UPI002F914E78|nr:hypothetical protein OG938_44235 [Streptomyces chartreusis]WSZ73435.1 hypothetical protein OG938_47560 [Streptomyces chartreusis]WTA33695.1 hypothetical protein OIA45_48140 [Streptomyces chartreusis]
MTTPTTNPLTAETPAIVAILTDTDDFDTMRRLTTFPFNNHTDYLHHVEDLLRTHADQGQHTIAVLFDPEDYADFCTTHTLDPTRPANRARYTTQDAITRTYVTYHGQNLTQLLADLTEQAAQHATFEHAKTLLAHLAPCPDCGHDTGRATINQATRLLTALLDHSKAGTSHLVCSIPTTDGPLVTGLNATHDPHAPTRLDKSAALRFTTVLAVGLTLDSPGGILMSTTTPDAPDRRYGWRLRNATLKPLTAAEVFNTFCTDLTTGDPIPPQSGVDYHAGFDLLPDTSHPTHDH